MYSIEYQNHYVQQNRTVYQLELAFISIKKYLFECVSKYNTSPFFRRADVYSGFFSPLSATMLILYLTLSNYGTRWLMSTKLFH